MLLILPTLYAAEVFEDFAFYLGDPHAHTGLSGDGGSDDTGNCISNCGKLSEAIAIARSNNLDWVAFPDHINGDPNVAGYPVVPESEYNAFFQTVAMANEPGVFVTLPAAEVWFIEEDGEEEDELDGAPLGHKTLLFFGDNNQLAQVTLDALQFNNSSMEIEGCREITSWARHLESSFGALILMPHHPAATTPMVTDWACINPDYEPIVEVYSEHGNNLWRSELFDPIHNGFDAEHSVEAALDPQGFGLSFGFAGGTDSHDTNPGGVCTMDTQRILDGNAGGLTIVALPVDTEFDRSAIYQAMFQHTTYVTTGPMVPMVVEWSSLGQPLGGLGSMISLPKGQPLTLQIRIPASLAPWVLAAQVVLPGDARTLEIDEPGSWSITLDEAPSYLYPALVMDGSVVYPDGCADGGNNGLEWIWGSPSWVKEVNGDVDGDDQVWPGAEDTWYDGVDYACDGEQDQDGDGVAVEANCDDEDPQITVCRVSEPKGCQGEMAFLWVIGLGVRRFLRSSTSTKHR